MKYPDSPDKFFLSIPKSLGENIDFRKTLHTLLDKDQIFQDVYLQMCFADPKIAYNSLYWTVNPRMPPGERNWPFILRPKQEIVVDTLNWCIDNQHDMGINKSRDEGATEMVCKMYALKSLIPNSYFIIGSRNKELVDSLGDPYTLFAKIDFAFECMPEWLKEKIAYDQRTDRKDMQLTLRNLNSVIRGETTNESFSAGRRATSIFLDEFGRVEPRVAESIEGSVHDVSGCVVYGSTHWYGENHPFNRALKKSTTKVVNLIWYENPVKSAGLYKSPDYDVIEIVDTAYYKANYPEIPLLASALPFKLSKLEAELLLKGYTGKTPIFIADACEMLPKGADLRSPWHDKAEKERAGNLRDFISNVWASPIGSQDSVFNPITLSRIETQMICPPKYEGEILFDYDGEGRVDNCRFSRGGRVRLKWWGNLKNGKPDISHNYVIGCDPSLGTGNSNSVAAVLDVNTKEIVGMWVCSNTPYELFADVVMALAHWLGDAYVIFENNGGHGINFGRRLVNKGCRRIYTQRMEEGKLKKIKNKLGWTSNPNTKADLLGELGIALSEGLKTKPTYISCKIYDKDILSELRGYVFYQDGDIGSTEVQDLTSGARKRHGDRVIAVGLAVLGSKYQAKQPKEIPHKILFDTFEFRQQENEKELTISRRVDRYGKE